MITEEEIRVELARRVMGWKIAPDDNRADWFDHTANYPCYDPRDGTVISDIYSEREPWTPFTDWNDAMGLAEKFRETHGWKLVVGNIATDDGSWHAVAISPRGIADWQQVRDKSGPRAVCMAIAKAAGIEVTR